MMATPKQNILTHDRFKTQTRLFGFLSTSLLFICLITLFTCQNVQAKTVDASIFFGPPLGETIILDGGDGMDIKRTTIAISESGIYSIEDRMRTPKCEVTQEDIIKHKFSEKVVRIMRGEEDLVDNYTLQVKGSRIILSRYGKVSIMLDLESREGIEYLSSSEGDIKMESRIVETKEEFIRGKKRSSLYVESYGKLHDGPISSSYRFVSGLGLIYISITNYGLKSVLYTLKEN
ncbi:hypothetical protein SAMN05660337_0372 [Maridesulfovibrio ferrireducens]|uniref:Uncharacterized protein n=1 Tax=Maridesulfovibrio ferrireducens TaxID=246191 RepID=A0A1G9BPA2_9BACT|nr:hypothetical protein [Maridesulfovibrio ferrireducens]SDK41328.1 hypothetical protein SAMN05660337_0372 [Maridesulfovibrio ferrireducens]